MCGCSSATHTDCLCLYIEHSTGKGEVFPEVWFCCCLTSTWMAPKIVLCLSISRILLIPAWYPWSAVMNSPALPAMLWLNLHENISETWDCCTGSLSFPKPKLQLLPGEHQITSKENFYSSGLFQFPWSRCFVCDWNMPPPPNKNFIKNFLCFTDFLNLVHSVPALWAWICWSQAGLLVLHMLQLHVVLLFGLRVIISLFCFLLFSISSVAILTERSLVPGFILAVKPSWTLRLHLKTRQLKLNLSLGLMTHAVRRKCRRAQRR